jgi:hypothetical protein
MHGTTLRCKKIPRAVLLNYMNPPTTKVASNSRQERGINLGNLSYHIC